jgi:hypothetical protein
LEIELMARYIAVTEIRHGQVKGDGADAVNEELVFAPGDEVKGLDRKVMRELWNQGALRQEGD